MSYMERGEEKRCDPHKVLPGVRTIVVLALNYFQGNRKQARRLQLQAKSHAMPGAMTIMT